MPEFPPNSVGIVQKKSFTFGYPPDELPLESGRTLGPITISYETYGELNRDKTNAILILNALSGDSHAAGYYAKTDKYPGWWDGLIGPKKAFDTNKYFIICSNVIGGCMGSTGPSSIYPITGKPYGMLFPVITIKDMVNAQLQLVEHLGINKLLCATGGSMGGMQALEWARSHPDRVRSIIPVACSAHLSPQGIAFNEIGRQTIMADPNWNQGDYYNKKPPVYGLAIARMIGHITYLSEEKMQKKFGRKMVHSDVITHKAEDQFEVESYLHYKGHTFVERFDANSYLYITRAIDLFDLSANGDLERGIKSIKCSTLFITMSSDWLFPVSETKKLYEILKNKNRKTDYVEIQSIHGHDGFLIETEKMTEPIKKFLKSVN
ncbi:MAG: homoserine O-acetyltransferase [Candidatus Margulisbacteria bacterium]|nr:homoserine O-acetyltransferase [Candidatus Margulisiibacteriota bacterium]